MDVYYQNHPFRFEQSFGDPMTGHLLLDPAQRDLLAGLLGAENETWYLDKDGERLPADQLFARSPWSAPTKTGRLKLLCRFINIYDGSVMFNTPEDYPGDTSSWVLAGAT
jgi:hypothetical protein